MLFGRVKCLLYACFKQRLEAGDGGAGLSAVGRRVPQRDRLPGPTRRLWSLGRAISSSFDFLSRMQADGIQPGLVVYGASVAVTCRAGEAGTVD